MKAKDIFMYSLGSIIVVGFFVVLIFLIISNKYPDSVNLVIGALIGSFTSVVAFNFGTTKSSADKTEMIYNSTKNQ